MSEISSERFCIRCVHVRMCPCLKSTLSGSAVICKNQLLIDWVSNVTDQLNVEKWSTRTVQPSHIQLICNLHNLYNICSTTNDQFKSVLWLGYWCFNQLILDLDVVFTCYSCVKNFIKGDKPMLTFFGWSWNHSIIMVGKDI